MIFKMNNTMGNSQKIPTILYTVINSPSTKAKNKIKIGLFITALLLYLISIISISSDSTFSACSIISKFLIKGCARDISFLYSTAVSPFTLN